MSRESILERNRKRAQENDQKMGATALGTSALNYSTQQSLERAAAEKVARESAGGLVDVPQPWLDTITPVTPSSRSARRWSGTTPSSRGGGFGETESQGRGYFSQADYSFLDRANDVIQGGLRQWAGGVGSAAGNVLDRTTSRYNSDAAGQWLDLVQDSMENRDDESYFERPEVQDRLENIRETREQTAPFVQEIYEIAEETGRQGTEQIERAKADLGPVGSFAVDVGTQVPQMLADAAFGAVTGGSALLPLGVRSYGYGVQEAMENGADRDQAAMYGVASGAKEALTEKLFSVALPFSRIYGGGSFDDAIQRGIQTAVERFASTPTGQRIVGGGLSLGASTLTEGAEEFISDWLGWQMPRIYGGDVATAEETLSDSLYDFLVGAAVGGLGGVVSPETYNYRLPTGQENAGRVVNPDTTTAVGAPEAQAYGQNIPQNDNLPEATRQAVDLLVSGQEITGGQAERIARSPEAVALLGQLTGSEINTDAPLSRVKADIRAVAGTRAASGTVSGQGQETAQTSQGTAPMVPQTERTAAQRVHDVNRVRGAVSSMGMGESGQRAISAAYDGSVDADRYYAGFTAYYEAGLSGRAQEQVRSDYAADLTEAQRYAAYTAGQNDAAASLQREQAGVNYATMYGDEAGFVPSEHSANLSQETTRFYNVLAKATGTKITVTAATGEGGANGWYRDGTIYISSDAQNAGEVVAMHEITHRLQEIAPEAYRKYRDYAVNALSELEGSSNALVERYKTLYSNSGINLTTEEAMDEAAANFAGELIRDPERFERLAREDRGVARRLLDAVKDLIRKIRRAIHGPSAEDVAVMNELGLDLNTLEQAARLWENALRVGSRHLATMTEEQQRVEFSDVNTRYSLRKKDPPKKTGVAYKVFFAKNGELYPPMVANPGGEGTPVGVWLDADVGQAAPPSKTGRAQVQAGGRGTNAAKGSLAFRPGWHLGDIPLAKQFARKNPATGVKDLFPADFVWAECEYAMDVDYQEEAMSYGYTENGKFRHSYAGLPRLPEDGYYRYRTNPNPDTVPWIITGAMRVTRILTDAETDAICHEAGVEPMQRQGGPMDAEKLAALGLMAGDVWADNLQTGARNDRMRTTRNSLKEDGDHGRAREETRGAFLRRAAGAGYAVYEGKTAGAYGYRRVDRESARENARQIQAEVSNLGIEADIISGPILINRNGETIERPVSHAVTIDRARILVNENSTLPPRNVAGHEAFHLWKSGVGRDAYIETVEDNLDFTREGFRNYQSAVSYALFGEEADLSDDGQMARLREELLAYISGDIHEGTNEDALRPMFRDFDAVRAAWERLVEENLGKTRFSLKAPVEEQGTLVALHNLTEEKLLASLNLGGFPMPSIAVTRADIPHENFGEITLVMDRRSVDPKANRKNTVYSADAWTPTFPAIEYEADQKAARRISQRIGELAEQVDPYFRSELQRMQYGQEDYLNSQGGQEGVVQWAMDHYGLKAAYLEEQGTHVKPVTRQQEAEKGYNPERAEKYRAVIQALGTTDPDAIGSMNLKEMRDQKGEALEAAFPGMTKSALRMSGILRQVQNFLREDGKPPVYEIVTDPAETRRAVDAALDQAGYEAWVRELYSGLEADRGVYNNKERFTPAGNSRTFRQLHYPVTLDGIVKAMAGQNGGNTKNVSGFYGVKSLRAGTARRFKSIVDMHKLEGRLQNLTETEQQAIADALDGRLLEITEELAEKSPAGMRPGDYAQMDSIGYILVDIAEGGTYTIDSVMKKFNDEYRYHIGNELAAKVRDLLFDVSQMPVNLFEAKPERAVGFDEVLAAVVPDDSGKALLDGLNQAGIRTLTYKKDSMSDRLEKVNSVEGAKFSLKGGDILRENAALQEENASLRERVEYWRGQTRRTTPGQVDKKAVDRAARELIRYFDSTISAADISGDLLSLYNYMGTGREGNDELTYTEARRRADEIARRVVESAQITEDGVYQEYRELRDYLRSTPLSISQEDASDIADYNDFRRRNFGRLNLRSGDTNIDQVYQELSEMWPEFFDEVRENNPVDQLLHISEVAEQLYRTSTGNPFAGNLREAQAGVSNEILERFFDIPQVRATFADRAAQAVENERQRGRERVNRVREQRDARITQLREQNRERVQRAIQRERDTRERQLERMKNRYQARDTAGRERRTARELRARISRHVRDLSRRLLRPSDKQHIPEQLRTAVAAMLDAINLESVYTVDRSTGRRQKGGEGDPTKRTEAFRQLRQAYSEITKDGADYTLVIDPDLMDNLDELAAMRNIPLAEMSIPQLTTVWDTVKAVEASVRTANKMLGQSRFQTISQVANGLKDDNILRQDRGDFKGILGRVDKLVNMDMLTPQSYFHRLGQTGDEMFRMLRTAQDRQIQIMHDAEQTTRDIIGKTDINKLERETHTFQVDGGTVTLSTAQIMSLYELMKREQAQEHIFTGGIRPETIPGQRGLRESRRSAPAHVTAENLAEMVGTLTDEQVEMADKLQQYMGGRLSELGNEASMEVYGYRKFTEPHYFPIQVDRNQTQRDISKEVQAQTIAGRGFTKSTAPRANNAVMVNSIFDVYASHVNDMATYAAWLPTMENVRRIRDFTFRDSEGNRTGTVKDIIERVFGRNGNPYLNKLVDDLNQGVRSTADPGLMDRIIGNYKAASVSANLRVILQQPTAILRALNTLDAKYLLAGTVKRGDWQKVKQYAPIAQWKDWGYFDINTGRQMKDVLFDSDPRLERLRQAGMAGASAADSFTWARLWNAVEAETKDRRKELKPGTKEFYQAVGQRFSEIVDQTQVVDGVLQRSHIMRSPDGLTKMTTSFMGEPTKSYNMFMNAVYDLRHATGKEARQTARRALARTSVALAVSFTINAVMQSLVDGLRDDDKELDYWERVQRAFIGFSGDEESFLDYWNSFWSGNLEASYNPLSYMPYFKDLLSIIQGYDVSRMDAEALEKVFTSGKNFWQALNGEGRYSLAGASASFLAELSRLLGLPVANLKRDIQGTVTSAAIETDDYWLQYQIDKALLNIGYSGNRSGFMDILYAASVNDPEAYELIYDDMIASGITQEQIRTSMETRMREAQGVESVADLTRRYLTPDQERTYNRIYSQMTSSAIWSAANEEQRESVEDDLYDLAAGTDAGQKLQEKIDGGASYGISDGDYLLYLAAREIADAANEDPEKRNGSIDQSEAEAAIDMLTGLSDEARAYLWQSTNKGWSEKNNPYR